MPSLYIPVTGSFTVCGTVGITAKHSYNNNNNNNDKDACKVMKRYPATVKLQR